MEKLINRDGNLIGYVDDEGRIKPIQIKEMPSMEMLEDFILRLYGGENSVFFDLETGRFRDSDNPERK